MEVVAVRELSGLCLFLQRLSSVFQLGLWGGNFVLTMIWPASSEDGAKPKVQV